MTFLYHRDKAGWRFAEDGETAISLESELEGSGNLAPDRFPVEISVVGHVQRDHRYFVLHKPSGRREMRGAELSKAEYKSEYDCDPFAAAAQLLGFILSAVAGKVEGSRPWTADSDGYLAHARKLFLELPPTERARDYLSTLPQGGRPQGYPHTCFVSEADDVGRVRSKLGRAAGAVEGGSDCTESEAPGTQVDEWRQDANRLRKEIADLGREREELGRQVANLTDSVAVRRKDAEILGEEVVALEEGLGSARREAEALEERIGAARRETVAHGATLAGSVGYSEEDEGPVKEETQARYESEVALLNERVSALQETFETRDEAPRESFRHRVRWLWLAAAAVLSLAALAVALTGNQEAEEAARSSDVAAKEATTAAGSANDAAATANGAARGAEAAAGRRSANDAAATANGAAKEATTAAGSANDAAAKANEAARRAETAAGSVDIDEDDPDTDELGKILH